jgi:hypothetical protein
MSKYSTLDGNFDKMRDNRDDIAMVEMGVDVKS